MKSIVTVNCQLPTIEDYARYTSDQSLLDYDIVLFDPCFPYLERIHFGAGGSCISIEDAQTLNSALKHWRNELNEALKADKTIFFLLNRHETDSIAIGSNSPRKGEINYSTNIVSNYSVLPSDISVRNAKGRKYLASDPNFKGIREALKDIVEYQVIINSKVSRKTFVTKKGDNIVGAWLKLKDLPGHLVLLPYFDLSEMTEEIDETNVWTAKALKISNNVVRQLVAIDNSLKSETNATPKPNWLDRTMFPSQVATIDQKIEELEEQIAGIQKRIEQEREKKIKLLRYTNLIFENGNLLEDAIKCTLELIGYKVENFRVGDLEIDHIIVGPSKLRMIGEAEGKDTTAVNISKFRQLESNINEDFEREEVEEPAKGILFGNGFRLMQPDQRESQFTAKCLTNAKRLGTALIRTSDLYEVALHLLNHPSDAKFKAKCREAIESTKGDIVTFPAT
jgi:hypothetical protein